MKSHAGMRAEYRPDIDGLRAVAVLAVIAFHMSKTVLPGGYLGVDIFFCLSGYLITSIIWRETTLNSFSLARFYERRVRRIAPALLTLMAVVTVVAAIQLLPADLIGYGKSALASLGFVANVYFWRDTNYFARVAEEKPLLHLWSLGVEEQFYIFFPLLLIALKRWVPRATIAVVSTLVLLSLVANVVAVHFDGASPAFFLLPTRAWELGIGALLALIPGALSLPTATRRAASLGGAALIIFALLWREPMIGSFVPAAFPAVAGTALLIIAGTNGGAISRLLATRPFVAIGLISYSLYLWHWPVLVFSRYYLVRELSLAEFGGAFIAMIGLAYVSWRYVEQPFRGRRMSVGRVYAVTAFGAAAIAVVAAIFIITDGLPKRLQGPAATINAAVGTNYRCAVSEYRAFGASRACVLNLPEADMAKAEVVLLGNSFAQMYAPIVSGLLVETGSTGILVPANGCLPTPTLNLSPACAKVAAINLEALEAMPNVRLVILGPTYHDPILVDPLGTVAPHSTDALRQALDALIGRLHARGVEVALIGPIAIPYYDVASEVSRRLAFGHEITSPLFEPEARFMARYGELIDHFASRRDVAFIRPDHVQCAAGECAFVRNDRSLFADSGHLAVAALPEFAPAFRSALERTKQWEPRKIEPAEVRADGIVSPGN
ncbi:acyltransferase family protein [Sphingoaurantiacus capsulatus]|uniref:Acyltransferase family protein n=1 Tax=Sphingoaurantiacus capsulatus TaxID=1771310 RepID=A0ABV7XCU8_9SPHN